MIRSIVFLSVWLGCCPWLRALPDLVFTVSETAGVARRNEVVCSGLPLPRVANVTSIAQLKIMTLEGQTVPACFHILARWNAGRAETNAPLQWLLVEMPVSLSAHQSRQFRLAVSEGPATPELSWTKLHLTQTNGQYHIDTGAAIFVLGGDANQLFDEIRLPDGTLAASGRPLLAVANGHPTTHATIRRMVVERKSDLGAVVVVDGIYDLSPIGEGRLASSRRYQFFAGSSAALVRHEVAWEGALFPVGILSEEGIPNGVRIQLVRNPLEIHLSQPRQALAWGEIDSVPAQGFLSPVDRVEIRQQLRARHADPLKFDLALGATRRSGQAATGGLLAVSDGAKTIGIALDHLHRFEPQALQWLTNGWLAVDVAADQTWLGARQGLFANFSVSLHPGEIDANELKASLWAKLNHPLRAWPSAPWFAASRAVEEFPAGELSVSWQDYDKLVPAILHRTTNLVGQLGLSGLQTYGLFPRYWGNPAGGYDELTNTVTDPTPAESWDDIYWGTTWTDYHNTAATAAYWVMRSGEVRWLDEITWPAARRMLHTQIIHGAPDDSYFYIGQAPAGYGGYRADFNSSHAYFDNLLLYYWLNGDYSVVETLQRGAQAMRRHFYPERPGVPCDPLRPAADEWAHPVGRVASQWIQVFRFIGLASEDSSFLEDFRGNLSRAVTQYYAELEKDGRSYGFWCEFPLANPGTNRTDQLWMVSAYDLNNLHRWLVDSGDAPLGMPARRPSDMLSAWGRTLAYLAARAAPEADGTAQGQWPNALEFVWSGDRLGGQLLSVTNYFVEGADNFLWDTGKASLCAVVSRAADFTGDSVLRKLAADLAASALRASWNQGTPPPLGKEQGLYLGRLNPALARLHQAPPAPRLQIARQEGQLILTWPSLGSEWQLESASSLNSGSWEPVTNHLGASGGVLEVHPTDNTFYRLRSVRNP